MNLDRIVDENHPEDSDLEYKHPDEKLSDIVKELASLANSGGGALVIGVVEQNGEIQSLESVENPGQLEEDVQQKIGSSLTPRLPVTHEVHEYRGTCDDFDGTNIVVFSVENDDRLFALRDGSKHVFPTRQGSTTRYMDGQEVVDFYYNGIYPGRASEIRDTERPDSESPLSEAVDKFFQYTSESEEKSKNVLSGEDDEIEFRTSRLPYFFTPTGDYVAVTFHSMLGLYQAHGFEGVSASMEKPEIRTVFQALSEHLDADLDTGAFTIAQRNGAWFGHGAGNFLKALDQTERYNSVTQDYNLDSHHSEGTIFITRINGGFVVVRARDGLRSDYVGQFSVSLLTDGVPIDNRAITAFLNETELSLTNGHEIDIRSESYHPGSEKIALEPVKKLESKHQDDWVGKIICKNPFRENPDILKSNMEEQQWNEYKPLTTYEYVLCKLSNHHPREEAQEYHLRRANLQILTGVQGIIPHLNASLSADW